MESKHFNFFLLGLRNLAADTLSTTPTTLWHQVNQPLKKKLKEKF